MSEKISAPPCWHGWSGRSFTKEELEAAKRLDYAYYGTKGWDGPAFWQTSVPRLDDLRQQTADRVLFLAALEREWDNQKIDEHYE